MTRAIDTFNCDASMEDVRVRPFGKPMATTATMDDGAVRTTTKTTTRRRRRQKDERTRRQGAVRNRVEELAAAAAEPDRQRDSPVAGGVRDVLCDRHRGVGGVDGGLLESGGAEIRRVGERDRKAGGDENGRGKRKPRKREREARRNTKTHTGTAGREGFHTNKNLQL